MRQHPPCSIAGLQRLGLVHAVKALVVLPTALCPAFEAVGDRGELAKELLKDIKSPGRRRRRRKRGSCASLEQEDSSLAARNPAEVVALSSPGPGLREGHQNIITIIGVRPSRTTGRGEGGGGGEKRTKTLARDAPRGPQEAGRGGRERGRKGRPLKREERTARRRTQLPAEEGRRRRLRRRRRRRRRGASLPAILRQRRKNEFPQ